MKRLLLLLLLLPTMVHAQSRPTAGRIMGGTADPTGAACSSTTTVTDIYIRAGVAVGSSVFICRSSVYVLFSGGSGGVPAGLTTQVQFNDLGVFGADTGFVYDKTTDVLTVNSGYVAGATGALSFSTRARITSPADSVFLLQNNAASDFSMLKFGGTTSTFPALKRTSTALGVRLADDSADGPFTASTGTFSSTVTSPIFQSTGTGAGTINFCEPSGTGTDCVTVEAPPSVTANYTARWPAAVGAGFLRHDGTNQLSFVAETGSGSVVRGTAPTVNGLTFPTAAGNAVVGQTVASGTSALGTSAISNNACASVVTTTATGTATTDVVWWGFNGDPTAVTGYTAATGGTLTIFAYPTANNVNYKVCNMTGASITPGAITLNWRIVR